MHIINYGRREDMGFNIETILNLRKIDVENNDEQVEE